jgi:hypothetical protein
MIPSLFHTVDQFRETFNDGLRRLLDDPTLGAYLLVQANATIDEGLHQQLRPQLLQRYQQFALQCREALRDGRELSGAVDDVSVFLKLMAIGFEHVGLSALRRLNDWELQFNHLRAFRPTRMTEDRAEGISRPFDPSGFHFNRPALRQEAIWCGELLGEPVELLYNKFPFVPLHGLLVPEREAELPQLLTKYYHDYIWRLCETLGEELSGWGIGYNSYGAYASVNHLHFQTFLRERPLPIMQSHWCHQGGQRRYPLPCERFHSPAEAWQRIEQLHRTSCSYNLIYLPGCLYCLPRRSQGSYEEVPWSSGFAWYEVAGGFVTSSREAFLNLDDEQIMREMGQLALPQSGAHSPSSHSSR